MFIMLTFMELWLLMMLSILPNMYWLPESECLICGFAQFPNGLPFLIHMCFYQSICQLSMPQVSWPLLLMLYDLFPEILHLLIHSFVHSFLLSFLPSPLLPLCKLMSQRVCKSQRVTWRSRFSSSTIQILGLNSSPQAQKQAFLPTQEFYQSCITF